MLESLELLLLGSRDEVNAVHPRMRIFSAIPNCKACAATLTCFSRYGCLSTWSPVFDRRMAELAKWVILSLLKKYLSLTVTTPASGLVNMFEMLTPERKR